MIHHRIIGILKGFVLKDGTDFLYENIIPHSKDIAIAVSLLYKITGISKAVAGKKRIPPITEIRMAF